MNELHSSDPFATTIAKPRTGDSHEEILKDFQTAFDSDG